MSTRNISCGVKAAGA